MKIPETLKPDLYSAIYRALYKDTRIINERDTGEHRRLTAVLVLSRVLEVLEGGDNEKTE